MQLTKWTCDFNHFVNAPKNLLDTISANAPRGRLAVQKSSLTGPEYIQELYNIYFTKSRVSRVYFNAWETSKLKYILQKWVINLRVSASKGEFVHWWWAKGCTHNMLSLLFHLANCSRKVNWSGSSICPKYLLLAAHPSTSHTPQYLFQRPQVQIHVSFTFLILLLVIRRHHRLHRYTNCSSL